MVKTSFRIHGMDCAEEIAVLKREVGPLVGGEDRLAFDLLNAKMTVGSPLEPSLETEIVQAVNRTGMTAVLWEQYEAGTRDGDDAGFWLRHGRTVLCGASGGMMAAGFLWHWVAHGSLLDALTSGAGAEGHAYPPVTVVLYICAAVAGGWFIAPKAVFAARRVRPDMNLLMTVAVIGAAAIGEWFEAAAVTFLFSLALLLESWSVGRARRAIKSLVDLSPTTARFISPEDDELREEPVERVPVGATVIVRPGEKVPLDGLVTSGSTSINQAPITGESVPVAKAIDDEVYAGTINGDGAIEFRVTKPASDTTLARIIHLVEEAQSRRAPSERWVEGFARIYTPAMMILALGVAVLPPLLFGGAWMEWFYQALVILVIACPCALVISTPVSIVAGMTTAARAGILIKGGAYLEAPARIKAMALDKTGTLTYGEPVVQQVIPLSEHSERELLSRAAALEAHSVHPLATAILKKAEAEGVEPLVAESYQVIQGKGAEATIEGREFWIGSHRFVEEMGAEDEAFHRMACEMEDAGHSLVVVGNRTHICGVVSVADGIRKDAVEFVRDIKELGVAPVVLLTGDNQRTAEAVAEATGVDQFRAELLPEEKAKAVEELEREYGPVMMVGDGVNDAPAMVASSLGVAMGAIGADAAIETADIALMSDDLSKLPWLIRHSRRTLSIIKQNIIFALGLKAAFIVLALGGMATLWMAIAADMGASLLVIFNGLRLLHSDEGSR